MSIISKFFDDLNTQVIVNAVVYTVVAVAFIVTFGGISTLPMQKDFYFQEQDPRLAFPKVTGQVSNGLLGFLSGGLPAIVLFILLAIQYFTQKDTKKQNNVGRLYGYFFLCTYLSLFMTMFFTELIKITVAEPRPNFYHYCNYQYINDNSTLYNSLTTIGKEGDYSLCRGSDSDTRDSRASFPSGHSSYCYTSATSIFFAMYYADLQSPLSYAPFVLATWVAITRIQDYYHNTYDVVAGMFLGLLISVVVWSQLHPMISKLATLEDLVSNPRKINTNTNDASGGNHKSDENRGEESA